MKLLYEHVQLDAKDRLFREKANPITEQIMTDLKALDRDFIASKMKIKGDLLEETLKNIVHFDSNDYGNAIFSYTGTVFSQLELTTYDDESIDYIVKNVRILSALYGSLNAMEKVKKYRLDMNMKLFDTTLYAMWEELLQEYYEDECIFNLASGEYSKMIKKKCIDIDFLVSGKRVAYHSKVARGEVLNFLIKHKVEDLELLKSQTFNGYSYCEDCSTSRKMVFVK